MIIARTKSEFDQWRSNFNEVGVVLTMGALHEGHASLARLAEGEGLPVVMTVFVNPTQFGPGEDLDRYPRTADADIEVAREAGIDCLWFPTVEEIYPAEEVQAGELGGILEGAARPGHFTGVLTVVNRFFEIIKPSFAVFGKKDRQQLALITSMASERWPSLRIIAGETVREADGLALSSRNRYLSPSERNDALKIHLALRAAADASPNGVAAARASAGSHLSRLDVDYCVVTDPSLHPIDETYRGPGVMLIAARVGATRLIDNIDLELGR